MDNPVEIIEVWVPSKDGEALRYRDGETLKRVAFIANGRAIQVAKDCGVEIYQISQQEYEHLTTPTPPTL